MHAFRVLFHSHRAARSDACTMRRFQSKKSSAPLTDLQAYKYKCFGVRVCVRVWVSEWMSVSNWIAWVWTLHSSMIKLKPKWASGLASLCVINQIQTFTSHHKPHDVMRTHAHTHPYKRRPTNTWMHFPLMFGDMGASVDVCVCVCVCRFSSSWRASASIIVCIQSSSLWLSLHFISLNAHCPCLRVNEGAREKIRRMRVVLWLLQYVYIK